MAARSHLPGAQWFLWLRNASLRIGVLTGLYFSVVFTAWLILANRVPLLDRFATERNLAAEAAMLLIAAIPVLKFRNSPARMLLASLTAWTLFALAYSGLAIFFERLSNRMAPFHLFTLGLVSYGFICVLDWVYCICAQVHQRHVASAAAAGASSRRGH